MGALFCCCPKDDLSDLLDLTGYDLTPVSTPVPSEVALPPENEGSGESEVVSENNTEGNTIQIVPVFQTIHQMEENIDDTGVNFMQIIPVFPMINEEENIADVLNIETNFDNSDDSYEEMTFDSRVKEELNEDKAREDPTPPNEMEELLLLLGQKIPPPTPGIYDKRNGEKKIVTQIENCLDGIREEYEDIIDEALIHSLENEWGPVRMVILNSDIPVPPKCSIEEVEEFEKDELIETGRIDVQEGPKTEKEPHAINARQETAGSSRRRKTLFKRFYKAMTFSKIRQGYKIGSVL